MPAARSHNTPDEEGVPTSAECLPHPTETNNTISMKADCDNSEDPATPSLDVRKARPPLLPLPPDGGYGWVIVFACFICNGLVEGCVGSFGIFLPHFAKAFETSLAKATIAGSLMIGGFLILGSIVSVFINCCGCRIVTITGAIMTVLAFAFSTLSPNIDTFIFIYGLVGGFGLAMMYLPAMVMVGYYFERRRSLATGIAYSGAGIGMVVMAPTCAKLLSVYDWRNALLLLATFPLQGIVLGALMRPLDLPKDLSSLEDVSKSTEDISESNDIQKKEGENEENTNKDIPDIQDELSGLQSETVENKCKGLSPTYGGSVSNCEVIAYKTEGLAVGSNHLNIPTFCPSGNRFQGNNMRTQSMMAFQPSLQENGRYHFENTPTKAMHLLTQSCMELPPDPHAWRKNIISYEIQNRNRQTDWERDTSNVISCQQLVQLPEDILRHVDMKKLRAELCKPLARQDVLYSGSVCDLPEFRQQPDLRSYIASVTVIPAENVDLDSASMHTYTALSKTTISKLRNSLQCSLFINPYFLFICLASVFIQLGYFVPIVFLPDYATSRLGVSQQSAALLISVIGLANTVGRAGSGALANLRWVNSLHLNNICLITCGAATILVCTFCKTFPLLLTYAAIFGLLMGAFVPLTTIFLVQYLGLHRLNNAMGLLSMVRGVSSMLGPPIAGIMVDKDSSHEPVFYFAGSMFMTAGMLFYLIPLYSWCKRKFLTDSSQNDENGPGDSRQRML